MSTRPSPPVSKSVYSCHPLSNPHGAVHRAAPSTRDFFALPLEIRNMIYASLISLSRPPDSLMPFSTSSHIVRHTLGISHPPPARQVSRAFDEEIQSVMHGPQFPSRLLLHLDIANPLATISVYEKLLWDEEVEFHGVPKRDIEKVERVELECDLSPNLHFMMEERQYEHQEEMDEWMASQLDWIRYDLLKEARALKEVRLRLTVGLESELEALEKQLPILEDWEEVKRIECVYEWRHGMRAWMGCDHGHSGESLRRVTVERRGGEWVVEKVFGRD